jgi:hypothetical protein
MSALSKQSSNRMLEPKLILLTGDILSSPLGLSGSYLVVATKETWRRIASFRGRHAGAWRQGHFEFERMVERRGIQ